MENDRRAKAAAGSGDGFAVGSADIAILGEMGTARVSEDVPGPGSQPVSLGRKREPVNAEDDGLGPADEDEDEPGLDGEDVDETSAGGLRYPDDPPQTR